MPSFDCAVFGAGVFGAWTAYQLRRSGLSVVLIDPYGPGNSRSSSGGESRIIRMSYGPDEIYTRWSLRSLELWKELLAAAGESRLFHETGVLWTVPVGHPRAALNCTALKNSNVAFETLDHAELSRRYPQIRFHQPMTAVLEPHSGVLLARRCVQAVVRAAVELGVVLGNPQNIAAGSSIYACGPWLPKLFPDVLNGRIRATRQEVFYFGTPTHDQRFKSPNMPAWLDYSDPRGAYALPDIESRGFKLAFDRHGPEVDPDTQERVVGSESLAEAHDFMRERFPDLGDAPILETRVCQYENTSSGDFLIDRHPEFENIWLVGGGSGHGFKHGPAVGEYVASLITGRTQPEPRFAFVSKATLRARAIY